MRNKIIYFVLFACLIGCQKNEDGSISQDLARSEAEAKALEKMQQHEDAFKSALFREGGAWVDESLLGKYTDCSVFLQETDQTVLFEKFQPNGYTLDIRVGARAAEWNDPDPIVRGTISDINDTHGDKKADIYISADLANVDVDRGDGDVVRKSLKYEKETDTLIEVDYICIKCSAATAKSLETSKKFVMKLPKREKFCKGSYSALN
jgi:hypothetical protein